MGQRKLGLEGRSLLKAMSSFGGGILGSGGPCGALTGGVAFLGSLLGKDEPGKKDDSRLGKACSEFHERFKTEVVDQGGSTNCRDIAGVDWKNKKEVKAFRKGAGRVKCINLTGKTARILGEVLEKYL